MHEHINRRDFLVILGGATATTLPVYAQQSRRPVIGYLGPETPAPYASRLASFRDGLAEAGFEEGRNVEIEFRWAEGQYTRLPTLAADLVSRGVDLVVATGGASVALAARAATTKVPIVFEMGGDPVAVGLVGTLSRPGGNLTGVSSLSVEVSRKRLEFMHELLPKADQFGVLVNPTSPTAPMQLTNLTEAAEAFGLNINTVEIRSEQDFEPAFAASAQGGWGGIVFTSDPYFAFRSGLLASLASRYAVPSVTQTRDFVNAGGLMSYGGDFTQSHRQAGIYAGRLLKGEKAADLPVQQVTKVELFLNLKTAASLGITIPESVSSTADFLVE